MRLAIYHNLPSGGAKKFLWDFVKRAIERHEIDLYRLADFDNEDFCDLRPIVNRHFDYRAGLRPGTSLARLRPLHAWNLVAAAETAIAKDIDARSYDSVFVHHCQLTTSPFLLRQLQTPSLYYMQEPRRQYYEYALMPRLTVAARRPADTAMSAARLVVLAKTKARDADRVRAATALLSNSYFSVESVYRAYGRYPTVSYLGVDERRFTPLEAQNRTSAVLVVGALHPSKAQLLLLDAISLIPADRRPAVNMVFDRADRTYRKRLEQAAREQATTLRLFENITEDRLITLYRSALVTACTSELEPFGLTALESIACGTPVVAVREGGFRETVIDGVNGLLVDRSAAELSKAIERVLRGEVAFSAGALRASVFPQFSLAQAVVRIESHLEQLAERTER